LTDVANAVSADPHWSHDGTKIAFGSNRNGGNVNRFVMNANGTDVAQLTNFVEPIDADDAGWSIDDSQIAFEWVDGGHDQSSATAPAAVWIMNANGSIQRPIGVACSDAGCAPRFQP
jgi:Tol biopolymer transport system component